MPDILYEEELEDQHGHLLAHGLLVKELSSESMSYAFTLVSTYGGPSTNDCLALALAKQENCPLITGDKRLRKAADQEKVDKRGTIWIIGQMLEHRVITADEADTACAMMRQAGSRLPWPQLATLIEGYRQG